MRYTIPIITTSGDKATALLFKGGFVRSLPTQIQAAAHRKLLMIDAATSVEYLYTPPGNRLEALQGLRSGQWSIRLIGIGGSSRLRPCHTTRHAGPHRAVREVEVM